LNNKKLLNCLVDCSTDTEISFVACCEECKKIKLNFTKKFSKAGACPESEKKIAFYRILYQKEREQLKEKMLKALEEHFNICPICQRIVCDDCFLICDDIDMCKSCAEMLEEEGNNITESL